MARRERDDGWTLRARPRLAWRSNVAFPAWSLVAAGTAAVFALTAAGTALDMAPLGPDAVTITAAVAAAGVVIAAGGRRVLALSRRL